MEILNIKIRNLDNDVQIYSYMNRDKIVYNFEPVSTNRQNINSVIKYEDLKI